MNGIFVAFEGIEGSGKTLQSKILLDHINNTEPFKNKALLTREPGGTNIATDIRNVLLSVDSNENLLGLTELLLIFAARFQHIVHLIQPALALDKFVICDRFIDATYAYQHAGRFIPIKTIRTLEKMVLMQKNKTLLLPDIVFLMDIEPKLALQRIRLRGKLNRIDNESIEFFTRVRNFYLKLASENKRNQKYYIINAEQSIEQIADTIKMHLNEVINKNAK